MYLDDDTQDFILKPGDAAFQEIGKAYFFQTLVSILEQHGMRFRPGMLEAFMEASSKVRFFGLLSVDEVRSVVLEHFTETTEEGHVLTDD